MWMASILQVLALGAVDPAAPLAASAAPAPIYWRQTLFSIPFHVEHPIGSPRNRSKSSCTYRRTGVCIGTIGDRPSHKKGYFLFKAGVDGEYWFDVRTLDRSGQIRPQGPHTPKLIVIVDTVPPKVQLTAVRGDAGQITAAFRIEELYPKLDSLAIEYRLADDRGLADGSRRPRKTSTATTPSTRARSPGIRKMRRGPWRFAFA